MVELNPVNAQLENPVMPTGRIVAGHPLVAQQVKDNHGAAKIGKDGQPMYQYYFGYAIPKQGEQHWSQTAWGQLIYNEGAQAFQRGEYQSPTFAWKITDGDSPIPNKKGKIPNQQEGYAGHWILNLSTSLPFACYKLNSQFGTLTECTSDKDFKRGDYGRVTIVVKGNADANGNAQTPGVYLNPVAFCMDKEGTAIVGDSVYNVDATAAFGGTVQAAPQMQAPNMGVPPMQQMQPPAAPQMQAPVNQQMQPPAAGVPPTTPNMGVPPNTSYMQPPAAPQAQVQAEVKYTLNGATYSEAELKANGWNDVQIQGLPRA